MLNGKAWKHTLSFVLALALAGSIIPHDIYAAPDNNFPPQPPENNSNQPPDFSGKSDIVINNQDFPENSAESIVWFSQIWDFHVNSTKTAFYFNDEYIDNISPENFQNGVYKIEVYGKNQKVKNYFFGFDDEKPVIESVLYNKQNNSLRFTAYDNVSGIDKYCVNGTNQYVDVDNYGVAYNVADAGAVTVIDKAGNSADYTEPQSCTLEINKNGYTYNSQVPSSQTVTLSASLSGNGNYSDYKFQYSTDGGNTWYETADGNISVSNTDGSQEYIIRAVCNDDSQFEICRNFTMVNVDTVLPENAKIDISGERDSQGTYTQVPVITITAPATDKTIYNWDGLEYAVPAGTSVTVPAEKIGDGKHTISASVIDAAGNTVTSEKIEINVNAVLPELTSVSANTSYRLSPENRTVYCKDSLSFTVSCNSETVKIIPVCDGNEINSSEYTSDGNVFTFRYESIINGKIGFKVVDLQDTERIYYIENVTSAGENALTGTPSVSADNAYTFSYENVSLEKPEINVSYKNKDGKSVQTRYNKDSEDTQTPWTNQDMTVTFSKTSDKEAGYQYKKAGDTVWTDYSGEIRISESDTYNFRSVSQAGAVSEELTVSFRIYRDMPSAESVRVTDGTLINGSDWYQKVELEVRNNNIKDDSKPEIYTHCDIYKTDYDGTRKLGYARISSDGQIDIYDEENTEGISGIIKTEKKENKFYISFLQTGEYEIVHWTSDETGNSTETKYDKFKVQVEKPVISLVDLYGRNLLVEKSLFFVSAELDGLYSEIDFGYSGPAESNAVVYEYKTTLSDEWKPCRNVELYDDNKYNIRVTATNKAGLSSQNITSTMVIDSKVPVGENNAPEITMKNSGTVENNIYSSDVDIQIIVQDPSTNNSYSGLNNVVYWVNDNETGQTIMSGTLFEYDLNSYTSIEDLIQSFKGNIKVPAGTNSNDITVYVQAEDNVGNVKISSQNIKIDSISPEITVAYSDDKPQNNIYKGRTATITVNEKNFSEESINITLNGSASGVNWSHSGNVHTAVISFTENGEQTFNIEGKDLAGNPANITYSGESPNSFTIDNVSPSVTIQYRYADNSSGISSISDGTFYNKAITAEITVEDEHLMSTDEFEKYLKINGESCTELSKEYTLKSKSSGNTQIYTITFSNNEKYSLSIDSNAEDLAGNKISHSDAEKINAGFTIDTIVPELELSGVEDGSANNGSVMPVVRYSDENIKNEKFTLELTDSDGKPVGIEWKLEDDTQSNTDKYPQGSNIYITNFEQISKDDDGFYTLTATACDEAGNSVTKKVSFSINREGPVYVIGNTSDDDMEYNLDGFLNNWNISPRDIKITVYDINKVTDESIDIIKDGNKLKESVDYDKTADENDKGCKYEYIIKSSNFADSGNYIVVLTATDFAENSSDNTVTASADEPEVSENNNAVRQNNTQIRFTIDNIAPDITFLGKSMEDNAVYPNDKTMSFTVDDNISVDSVSASITYENEDGSQPVTEEIVFEKSYDAVEQMSLDSNADGTVSFEKIGSDSENKIMSVTYDKDNGNFIFTVSNNNSPTQKLSSVTVQCSDTAGNSNNITFSNITITSSNFQIYKKQILISAVIIAAVLISAGVILSGKGKRKKSKQ